MRITHHQRLERNPRAAGFKMKIQEVMRATETYRVRSNNPTSNQRLPGGTFCALRSVKQFP